MEKQTHSIDQLLERISVNPKVMVGKPVIRGTRVPVELIVKMLAQGIAEEEILREYPRLELEDIKAALAYEGGAAAMRRQTRKQFHCRF